MSSPPSTSSQSLSPFINEGKSKPNSSAPSNHARILATSDDYDSNEQNDNPVNGLAGPGDNTSEPHEPEIPTVKATGKFAHLLKFAYFYQGIGMLFPWNALITGQFMLIGKVPSNDYLNFNLDTVTVFIYLASNFLFVFGNMFVKLSKKSEKIVVLAGYALHVLTFSLVLIATFQAQSWMTGLFLYFIFSLAGIATALVQNNIMAASSLFEINYSTSTWALYGQAISGIAPPLVALATTLLAGDVKCTASVDVCAEEKDSSNKSTNGTFFGITLFVAVTSALIFAALPMIENAVRAQERLANPAYTASSEDDENQKTNDKSEESGKPKTETTESTISLIKRVCEAVWPLIVSLFLLFFVSLCIFPGYTSKILPFEAGSPETASDFAKADYAIRKFMSFHFFLFNLGDLAGRFLPPFMVFMMAYVRKNYYNGTLPKITPKKSVFIVLDIAFARVLYIFLTPLFLARTENFKLKPNVTMAAHRGDFASLFYILTIGLTTGAIATASFANMPTLMIRASSDSNIFRNMTGSEMSMSGRILTLSLILGLVFGAGLGILYSSILFEQFVAA